MGGDSPDVRDRFVITPHINDGGTTADAQDLCNDWADVLVTRLAHTNRQIEVTAYDAQGTPPVFPQGYAIRNTGLFPASECPREIAVCLSFFSERNLPRQRGRLYIPMAIFTNHGFGSSRPGPTIRAAVGALAQDLADLGGTSTDWSVYSRVDDEARAVSDWYVDDEWDTIRSRGLRPTARTAGTVGE